MPFPNTLGVIVQNTIIEGREPVRCLVLDADGHWFAGDGVNDPNVPGAVTLVAFQVLKAIDSTVDLVSAMDRGMQARREHQDQQWSITPIEEDDAAP